MIQVVGGVDQRLAAGCATIVIDKDVAHNGKNPTFEIGVVNIFVVVVEHFQIRFLHQVLCVFLVQCQRHCKIAKMLLQSLKPII